MQNSDYLISENPMKALVFFSLPMIIGNLFQQAYTMADSAIVGRLVGENALAAVGAAYSLTNIFICIAIGGGIGASVIVSQYFGRGSCGKLKKAVYTALISFLLISGLLGGFGLLFSRKIMIALNTPAERAGYVRYISENLFSGSAISIYVQCAVLNVQCTGKITDSVIFSDFFFGI